MRLIDADELKNQFADVLFCDNTHIMQTINSTPTIEAEPFKTFAQWVASEVCNTGFEDMWSLGAFAEVACRKLYALGVVQKFRDEWVYLDKDELDGGEND